MWLKQAISNGSLVEVSNAILEKLKRSETIKKICHHMKLPPDCINNLKIVFMPLNNEYAETDATHMKINDNLLKQEDFFEKYMFVFAHEIIHYFSRLKGLSFPGDANKKNNTEEHAYFDDQEEVLGFIASIAYLMENGHGDDHIRELVYPKIEFHFNDNERAQKFFKFICIKAHDFLEKGKPLIRPI